MGAVACYAGDLPRAVEELLRFLSPVLWLPRVAQEDVEMHGSFLRALKSLPVALNA
jgi:cytochrome P450